MVLCQFKLILSIYAGLVEKKMVMDFPLVAVVSVQGQIKARLFKKRKPSSFGRMALHRLLISFSVHCMKTKEKDVKRGEIKTLIR